MLEQQYIQQRRLKLIAKGKALINKVTKQSQKAFTNAHIKT